jgi:hypothetical protein
MLCLDPPQWFFDYVNRLECGFLWSAAMQAPRAMRSGMGHGLLSQTVGWPWFEKPKATEFGFAHEVEVDGTS